MKINYLLIGLLLVLISACDKKEEVLNDDLFKVSGTVYQEGKPARNVKVSIDNALNYTVLTNENGEFKIQDVTKGNHNLEVYKASSSLKSSASITDGSEGFIVSSYNIDVNSNVLLDAVKLPKPVKIDTIIQLDSKNIHIAWTSTDAQDFREYKLFKHSTSGLDERTGELVHISTDINDTTYKYENITANETYFFRIYIMNEYGKLGGSNIESIITINQNLFEDSGFETENALGFWGLSESNEIQLDAEIKYNGQKSLHLIIDTNKYTTGDWQRFTISKKFSNLAIGEEYTFSFWWRLKGNSSNRDLSDYNYDIKQIIDGENKWSTTYPIWYIDRNNITEVWYQSNATVTFQVAEATIYIEVTAYSDLWLDDMVLIQKE